MVSKIVSAILIETNQLCSLKTQFQQSKNPFLGIVRWLLGDHHFGNKGSGKEGSIMRGMDSSVVAAAMGCHRPLRAAIEFL